jgi:hypothetical protein
MGHQDALLESPAIVEALKSRPGFDWCLASDDAKLELVDAVVRLRRSGVLVPLDNVCWSEDELLETVSRGGNLRFALCSTAVIEAVTKSIAAPKHVKRGILAPCEGINLVVNGLDHLRLFYDSVVDRPTVTSPSVSSAPHQGQSFSLVEWIIEGCEYQPEWLSMLKITTGLDVLQKLVCIESGPTSTNYQVWSLPKILEDLRKLGACAYCQMDLNTSDDANTGRIFGVTFFTPEEHKSRFDFYAVVQSWSADRLPTLALCTAAKRLVCELPDLSDGQFDASVQVANDLICTVLGKRLSDKTILEIDSQSLKSLMSDIAQLRFLTDPYSTGASSC